MSCYDVTAHEIETKAKRSFTGTSLARILSLETEESDQIKFEIKQNTNKLKIIQNAISRYVCKHRVAFLF